MTGSLLSKVTIGGAMSSGVTYLTGNWYISDSVYYTLRIIPDPFSVALVYYHDGTHDIVGRLVTTS